MQLRILFAASALAIAAAPAQAAVFVSPSPTIDYSTDVATTPNSQIVWDFDGIARSGFNLTFSGGAGVTSGTSATAAAPPGDATNYAAVRSGGAATLTSTDLLDTVSIFMGSPDSYNFIRFIGPSINVLLNGVQLAGGTNFHGVRTVGERITYSFGGQGVNQVIFGSNGNSFEFDRIGATVLSAVPEPVTWAMMTLGFFGAGALLRRKRRLAPQATTA